MELLREVVSGIVSAILATAILTVVALIWRWRLIRKYKLTKESKKVLEALWDENLLRREEQIARETEMSEADVKEALRQLADKKLARERIRKNGLFWKITLRGKEYLKQLLWLDNV
jgi:DNA-binding MarR family transcriptional regulator